MFTYKLGNWTLEFSKRYRMVCDGSTAVALDESYTTLALVSLAENGNLRVEWTPYEIICEIDAANQKATFHITDEIGSPAGGILS